MSRLLCVFLAILPAHLARAAAPGLDSMQLQRLIQTSQQQLRAAHELLEQARQDAANIERAAKVLDQLAKGLDQQIQPLQGSPVYSQALLRLQQDSAGATQAGAAARPGESAEQAQRRENFVQFQQQSHRANLDDVTSQEKLSQALAKAQPGFVPKIHAQAELGSWQTNVRISAQLTELLAALQGLRKDLGESRGNKPEGFGLFLSGSAAQAKKLQQGVSRVP